MSKADNGSNLSALLLGKALTPLSGTDIAELKRIETLDVSGYSEEDVRAEIIDQMLRIIGYRKGQYSSVDREKHISFRGKTSRYIDYNLTLWAKNFWLIEAKKPLSNKPEFGYDELRQAVEYAAHPQIQAALVVLCDGLKLEVFDREESVSESILSFPLKELTKNFDAFRALLAPLQVWYYYRRRIVRALDRVFEHELNQGRVNEFKDLVDQHLDGKRQQIVNNMRAAELFDPEQFNQRLRSAGIDEVVDIHFFGSMTGASLNAVVDNLVEQCRQRAPFHVLHHIFPDEPRDANDLYYPHALALLMKLDEQKLQPGWMPKWLCPTSDVEAAVKRLIKLCLNHFDDDPSRKTILLAANVYRRIFKLLALVDPRQRQMGTFMHSTTRYFAEEFDLNQLFSSPKQKVMTLWDTLTMTAVYRFVKEHRDPRGRFSVALAKRGLQELWRLEQEMLARMPDHRELLNARDLNEIHPTEIAGVAYDRLGHNCLCILGTSPKWQAYALVQHREDIETLAAAGSWAARGLIGEGAAHPSSRPLGAKFFAHRFFFDDEDLFRRLVNGYGIQL